MIFSVNQSAVRGQKLTNYLQILAETPEDKRKLRDLLHDLDDAGTTRCATIVGTDTIEINITLNTLTK